MQKSNFCTWKTRTHVWEFVSVCIFDAVKMLVMYLKNIDVWFQIFGVLDGMLVKVFFEQTCEVYIWSFTFWVKNGTASWCYWTISYKTYIQSKNICWTNGLKRHSIICLIYSLIFIIDKKHTWKRKDHAKNRTLYVFDVRGDVHLCGNGQNH
jgi:hypothetical protein